MRSGSQLKANERTDYSYSRVSSKNVIQNKMKQEKGERVPVSVNESAIKAELKDAEGYISNINDVRHAAMAITGHLPESLDGRMDVRQALTLKDYPSANLSTAANLLGLSNELKAYDNAVARLENLERYEIKNQAVVLSADYTQSVTDKHTTFLSGKALHVYRLAEKVAGAYNKANEAIGNPIVDRVLLCDYRGHWMVNAQAIPYLLKPMRGL